MASASTIDDGKAEISKIIEEWNEKHLDESYDPIPLIVNQDWLLKMPPTSIEGLINWADIVTEGKWLRETGRPALISAEGCVQGEPSHSQKLNNNELAERFEKETEIFHKQDPDPFDDRHPVYVSPSCALGKLLKALLKHDDFLECLTKKYFRSHSGPTTDKQSGELRPPLAEVAARLLLVLMPGLDANTLFSDNAELIATCYRWAMGESETLRTYATGILAVASENQDFNNHHTSDNNLLVPILLQRLWNYVQPGKYPRHAQESRSPGGASESKEQPFTEQSTQTLSNVNLENKTTKSHNLAMAQPSSSIKRKLSGDFAKKAKCRKTDMKLKDISPNDLIVELPQNSHKQLTSSPSNRRHRNNSANLTTGLTEVIDVSECSNSSWAEMAPIVIGYSYSFAPPLSANTCQRCILNLLIPLGEYQDFLSHFLEFEALDLVRLYVDKSNTNDGLITFSALRFLASLLCHNKIATSFVDGNGVQKLLSIRRPSIGATGVSLCIYYLAFNHDAMERVCQLPSKVLFELVRYATWLLECSHDSGQCHAALFFNISFQFHSILKLFDQRNGLRCLLNMLSTLPIIRLDDNERNKEDEDACRQTARTACQAIRKYFETHLVIKATNAKEILKISATYQSSQRTSSKVIECDRESVFEYLDFLLEFGQPHPRLSANFLNSWSPVQAFMKLDGTRLLLRLIALACDWTNYWGRADIVRFALDCLAVVTLSHKAQIQLCEPVNLPPSLTEETGMSIVLGVAEGDAYLGAEPEAQKSALSVIVNCVCGPEYKFDGAMGKVVNGTPQTRVISKSTDDVREKLWECVQTNNGIKILTHLLIATKTVFHVDEIRLLACKALCGLSRCESVKQIMSKLPIFTSGQLQSLTRQPVMQDGRKQRVRFCKYVEELTERVSGKPTTLDMDLDSLRKAHIVSQTIIRYDNLELLQLIHNHLVWSGLHSSASMLTREASLHVPATSAMSVITTPKSTPRNNGGSGDAPSSSPHLKRISFCRGTHAQGQTPTLPPHSSLICTPTSKKGKTKFRFEVNSAEEPSANISNRYRLSSHGKVTVAEPSDILSDARRGVPSSPTTLNSIVAGYLQNQHSHCKNPVVTVPEFSLLKPHYCPDPRFRVEAPYNVVSRYMRKQVVPQHGGLGGASCDRQYIFSRFRPHFVFRAPEEGTPYTCCAFTPDDMNLVLGNYQGDVTIHSLQTDQDRVVEGVANAPIVKIEPASDGKRMLIVEEGTWQNTCSLLSMNTIEVILAYEDVYYVEFSKTIQDKVIGTKNSIAIIYDAETGQRITKFERPDLASHYSTNRATFSPDDNLVLSDGLLWDARSSGNNPIHKFDKFNTSVSGVFHPQGLEVIINTEVAQWDLRNYHLLHTVPSVDQCSVHFNRAGTVFYAAKEINLDLDEFDDEQTLSGSNTFMAIDAHTYKPLSVTDTKHKIYDLAADRTDCYVAVIERQNEMDQFDASPGASVCRLYEVGRVRGEDEEDQEEEALPDDDEDNNEDDGDDLGGDDLGGDGDGSFSETGTGSSYDTPSFAVSLSSESSYGGRRRRRRRRRHLRGGGYDRSTDDEDDDWATMSENSSASEQHASDADFINAVQDALLSSDEN